jgi:glycosyltransferase involved in cell wall biosynthesis
LPSRWELSPLTPLEGFAFKKAVISTTAHGIPYTLKDGENSILVDPADYQMLAEKILTLLNDKKLCEKLGESGYNSVHETQNSVSMVKNIFKIYEQVI